MSRPAFRLVISGYVLSELRLYFTSTPAIFLKKMAGVDVIFLFTLKKL